jgi:hypothetical protein
MSHKDADAFLYKEAFASGNLSIVTLVKLYDTALSFHADLTQLKTNI